MLSFLQEEGISPGLLEELRRFRECNPPALPERVPTPRFRYYGREVWEQAIAALLCGKNLLLTGGKATGKNVLAENLAAAFDRPPWNISFHVNLDASGLVGMDTFGDGQVQFRPGPICQCARYGGIAILDEINMAKNEALASRFVVLQMPPISPNNLNRLLERHYPALKTRYRQQLGQLFFDLQKKCESSEISDKALDLRGLLDALELMEAGVPSGPALDMGITNKTPDRYEQGLIRDVIAARVPPGLTRAELFA